MSGTRTISRSPRLRPGGRLSGCGILGPEVARIAAAKGGADGSPGTGPKARQVPRDLDRAVGGREQMKGERGTTASQRRVLVEPEQLLDSQRDRRAAIG